jgi:hypothetical protein
MKLLSKFLLVSALLTGLQFSTSGCVADGYASESVYYGHRDPWFRDDRWMDGRRRGYRDEPRGQVDVYISPPRLPAPPRIHLP